MSFCQTASYTGGSMMANAITLYLTMSLPARLIALRKERGLTQQQMADSIGIHVNSLKKYESGHAQPSLDVLKKIALALNVSTDFLLFEDHERDPSDELALQFEAVSQLPGDEQRVVMEVLESLIIKYQARRWDTARTATAK
jgi:transcriptional regulator with XRE-family HTH domain